MGWRVSRTWYTGFVQVELCGRQMAALIKVLCTSICLPYSGHVGKARQVTVFNEPVAVNG
jgi:hypothetical protein